MFSSDIIHVLHVIPDLTLGGAGRALFELHEQAVEIGAAIQEKIVSLNAASPEAIRQAKQVDITVLDCPDHATIIDEIKACDVVLVHFWNSPELQALLCSELPAMRIVFWSHIFGAHPPHIISDELVAMANIVVSTTPSTQDLPAFRSLSLSAEEKEKRTIPGIGDFSRLKGYTFRPHEGINIGYVGTVDYVKMHPQFASMTTAVKTPDARFVVCGTGGAYHLLIQHVKNQGIEERFDFRGYVEDILSVLETLDIFGYPLCEDTYATSERSLQEAMYVGVPPVVFPYGGIPDLIADNDTGLVVRSEKEYVEAIEHLCENPDERKRIGENARNLIRRKHNEGQMATKMMNLFDELLSVPKRMRNREPLIVADAVDDYSTASRFDGAKLFIRSIGDSAPWFAESMADNSQNSLHNADERIAASSPLLSSVASGGILNYRKNFPDDGYLAFWSGLVLARKNRPALALAEFIRARRNGVDHWRIDWHLARTAAESGAGKLGLQALDRLIQKAPDHEGVDELRARLTW